MPKIDLPPKVKCWRCEGTGEVRGKRITMEEIKSGLDEGGNQMVFGKEPCPDCDAGERYVFDDLAAAIRAAGLTYRHNSGSPQGYCTVTICRPNAVDKTAPYYWELATMCGPSPTTALLNVITNANAR